jgi:hypothetical protein
MNARFITREMSKLKRTAPSENASHPGVNVRDRKWLFENGHGFLDLRLTIGNHFAGNLAGKRWARGIR